MFLGVFFAVFFKIIFIWFVYASIIVRWVGINYWTIHTPSIIHKYLYRSVSCSMVLFIAMCFVQSVLVFRLFSDDLIARIWFSGLNLSVNFYMFLFLFIFFGNCIWPGLCLGLAGTCCKVIKTISEEYGGSDFFLWIWKRKLSYDFKKNRV